MAHHARPAEEKNQKVSAQEVKAIETRARLRAPVIYEVVRLEGQTDMVRPAVSLFWSGLAAGLSLSFSLFVQALLRISLPVAHWRDLVTAAGYAVGFIMVVLSRQQLFTESTITVVLPLLANFNRRNLTLTARMWLIVLCANIAGTLLSALFCTYAPVLDPALLHAMLSVSRASLSFGWWDMLFRAVGAGFLIAAMVWLIPSAKGSEFHVVFMMTYVIALGRFAHVVAGSMEGFMLVLSGQWTPGHMVSGFLIPTLSGNVIGGTALFALISYAQVMEEM